MLALEIAGPDGIRRGRPQLLRVLEGLAVHQASLPRGPTCYAKLTADDSLDQSKQRMVTRRRVFLALGASALTAPCASLAQVYGARIPHIEYLSQGSEADHGVFLGI
jgi:hypothetical protein